MSLCRARLCRAKLCLLPSEPNPRVGLLPLERPEFDWLLAGGSAATRPLPRSVEARSLDDPEAADVLLGFSERSVRHDDLLTIRTHHLGSGPGLQARGEHKRVSVNEICVEIHDLS